MPIYTVDTERTFIKKITIKAKDEKEALHKAEMGYLNYKNCIGVTAYNVQELKNK